MNDVKKYPYSFSGTLVVPHDALGDATTQAFNSAVNGKAVKTIKAEFPSDDIDVSPAFQKAVGFRPDWVFMEGAGDQAPRLLTARVKASGDTIPTLAGITASSQPLLSLAKRKELDKLYATFNVLGA